MGRGSDTAESLDIRAHGVEPFVRPMHHCYRPPNAKDKEGHQEEGAEENRQIRMPRLRLQGRSRNGSRASSHDTPWGNLETRDEEPIGRHWAPRAGAPPATGRGAGAK